MAEIRELFHKKTIEKLTDKEPITTKQKRAASEWLELLSGGELKEKQNYLKFNRIILTELLDYPDMAHEEDNVEFSYNSDGKSILKIEVKGTDTKDLFAKQKRINSESPVEQLWRYMNLHATLYGIVTNYKQFILFKYSEGSRKFYLFNFESIRDNPQKLKEFVAIFSRKSLDSNFIEKLTHESEIEEREFTKEFYKLYHETRLMLIKEFKENGELSDTVNTPIHFAQLFLNRLMFIFFAEDTEKLPKRIFEELILKELKSESFSEYSKRISFAISEFFQMLNTGQKEPITVFAFNGGLFNQKIPERIYFKDKRETDFFKDIYKHSKLKKEVDLGTYTNDILAPHKEKLNPIIRNLLVMASFDFNTEVNVNILGHIFEQSLSDLEELKNKTISRRKKEGVYYTPEYITDYICRNTIIPYLSKKDATDVKELVTEYTDNISELEEKFKNIKILDPACGSGAFLIKAVDILLEIFREIQNFKQISGAYTKEMKEALNSKKGQKSLIKSLESMEKSDESSNWIRKNWEEQKAKEIIERNIYGVDINEESVDITKLSLFLKMATKNRKLIDLSKNIKQGNSLIDNKDVDIRAFNWEEQFKDIFDNGGFDVVIGNPPYVRIQNLQHCEIDWYKINKKTAFKRVDISILFIELAKNLLKEHGIVSYITSNQFLSTEYGEKLRKFILDNYKIKEIIDFGDLPIFEDALTYVSIFIFENSKKSNFRYLKVKSIESARNIKITDGIDIAIDTLCEKSWVLTSKVELDVIEKLNTCIRLSAIGNTWAGLFTGLDNKLMFDKTEIDNLNLESEVILPVIRGGDSKRYTYTQPSKYVLYPYIFENNKTTILNETQLKEKYPLAYNYLLQNKSELIKRKDSRKTFANRKDWYSLVRFGQKNIFNKIKIVTPGEVKDHKFSLDISGSGFSCARIFAITIDNNSYDIKYILTILNSTLIKFYLHNIASLKQGGFYTYSSSKLNQVPIKQISSDNQTPFIKKADIMLDLNKQFYDKKQKFLTRLKDNLSLEKITKKLDEFYTLDFKDVLKELKKQKIELSLDKQDEWEEYFEKYKKELIDLKETIDKTDKEIDKMVYNLYNLTDDEIKIIENTVVKKT